MGSVLSCIPILFTYLMHVLKQLLIVPRLSSLASAAGIFPSTEGLSCPVLINRFGNPTDANPRQVRFAAPFFHFSFKDTIGAFFSSTKLTLSQLYVSK